MDGRRAITIGHGVAAAGLPDGWTRFDTARRRIAGAADPASERLANELRRYGIRFYSRRRGDRYVDWEVEPPSTDVAPEPAPAPQSERTSDR